MALESQYITVTMIEDADDFMPAFELDTTTIAPQIVLKIGRISMHFTPERLAQLGRLIAGTETAGASTVTETSLCAVCGHPEDEHDFRDGMAECVEDCDCCEFQAVNRG